VLTRIALAGLAALLAVPALAPAQVLVPVPLAASSFNQDIVADVGTTGSAVGNSITATMDDGTTKGPGQFTWYQLGQNPGAATTGLPTGTTITSQGNAQATYQLQPAAGNNALLMGVNTPTSGTLTFQTPRTFAAGSTLSLLSASGHGAGTLTLTLMLQGGGTVAAGTVTSPDWFNGDPTTVVVANGRVDSAGAYDQVGSGNPRLNGLNFALPAGAAGVPVTGVSIDFSGAGTDTITAVFGLSASPVPEPGTLALSGLGLGGLIALRRRGRGRK
jgi:hypothetical protein